MWDGSGPTVSGSPRRPRTARPVYLFRPPTPTPRPFRPGTEGTRGPTRGPRPTAPLPSPETDPKVFVSCDPQSERVPPSLRRRGWVGARTAQCPLRGPFQPPNLLCGSPFPSPGVRRRSRPEARSPTPPLGPESSRRPRGQDFTRPPTGVLLGGLGTGTSRVDTLTPRLPVGSWPSSPGHRLYWCAGASHGGDRWGGGVCVRVGTPPGP